MRKENAVINAATIGTPRITVQAFELGNLIRNCQEEIIIKGGKVSIRIPQKTIEAIGFLSENERKSVMTKLYFATQDADRIIFR